MSVSAHTRSPEAVLDGSAPAHGLRLDFAAALALAWRDLRRFFRQPSRVIGALGQPLVFWAIFGLGLRSTFRVPGAEQLDYLQYFFPGVLVMIVLFTAIYSTMSVIEDRHSGFLQTALVAPISRFSIVLGKALGGTAIALIQGSVLLLLCPVAGYSFMAISWPLLLLALGAGALAINAMGLSLAWTIDSTQGYHAVMMVGLMPLWVLSGAMFPISPDNTVLTIVMYANPMTYAVALARKALSGGVVPSEIVVLSSTQHEMAILAVFALAMFVLATVSCRRRL